MNVTSSLLSKSQFRPLVLLGLTALTALRLSAADAAPRLADQKGYQLAGLDPKEPELDIVFPGAATTKGIPEGSAVVTVSINAQGQATDFVVTSCTDKAFGQALLDHVKPLRFRAGMYNGVAVPGRCDVGYRFINRSSGLNLTALDASRLKSSGSAQPKPAYDAVAEKNLDQPLAILEPALPMLPAAYTGPTDKPVKVFVTFYIDEEGKARLPQAESAAAPELIAPAVKAVGMWVFKPATVKGKPVLVYTGRAIPFLPRNPPAEPAPAAQ